MSATLFTPAVASAARQRIEHFHRRLWIVEVHGAELNRRCAGDEEFHDIVDRGDAADADERRFHGLCGLVNGPQRDRLDRRAAEAAHDVAEHRPSSSPVDRHAEAGVDERDRVGPASLGGFGHRGDARHVRRELGDDRRGGCRAAIGDQSLAHRRIGSEVDAARNVGAGNIELDRRDAGQVRSSRAVICTNSSCERPAMLTMIGTPSEPRYGK